MTLHCTKRGRGLKVCKMGWLSNARKLKKTTFSWLWACSRSGSDCAWRLERETCCHSSLVYTHLILIVQTLKHLLMCQLGQVWAQICKSSTLFKATGQQKIGSFRCLHNTHFVNVRALFFTHAPWWWTILKQFYRHFKRFIYHLIENAFANGINTEEYLVRQKLTLILEQK